MYQRRLSWCVKLKRNCPKPQPYNPHVDESDSRIRARVALRTLFVRNWLRVLADGAPVFDGLSTQDGLRLIITDELNLPA